jgi:hypothetical protein
MTCACAEKLKDILGEDALLQEIERQKSLDWDQGILDSGTRESGLEWVRGLGNPPRGFFQADGGFACDDFAPAYVRGILMPTPYYDGLSFDEKFALQNADVYPRWRLYGGPFNLKQDADAWDNYLFFYAFNSNQTWVSHGTVCIVPPSVLAWPADQGVRWDWVNEARKPDLAQKVWNSATGRYDIVWV